MPSLSIQNMADQEESSTRPSLQRDSTLEEEDHDTTTFSSNTIICSGTPSNDLSTENQTKDATTPVLAAPLPSMPPQSPRAIALDSSKTAYDFSRAQKRQGSCRRPDRLRRVRSSNVGVVIGDFNGLYPDEMSLKVGQRIEIISKDTVVSRNIGWWTGRNESGKIGIFPAACVAAAAGQNTGSSIPVQSETGEYPLAINSKEVDMKEVIGIGGFGKVYRAIYRGEEVAVKVAKSTTFNILKAVQEVIAEAEKFAHLTHENICALIGVVLVEDICLVMEYARGGALSDLLYKRDVSLPIDIILNWATQIAAGMHYLHHEVDPSLIHRDLKSSNILLTKTVDPKNLYGNTMKISDFGLAREIEHTTHMSGAGTYPWMAPEVITSSDYSKKSDVWSFAVVLWELITGERPFSGLNLYVVAFGVGSGSISLPIPDGCPEPFVTLMNACWERMYTSRPSFQEILTDLKQMEKSDFVLGTSHEEFRTMQGNWREEIQQKFIELKQVEDDIRKRESKLRKRAEELEEQKRIIEERERVIEEREKIVRQLSLNQQKSEEVDGEKRRQEYTDRPPRTKMFKIQEFLAMLKEKGRKAKSRGGPLPNKVRQPNPRRVSNSPLEKKSSTLTRAIKTPEKSPGKRASLPVNYYQEPESSMVPQDMPPKPDRGHRRYGSGDFRRGISPDQQHLSVGAEPQRRGSVPSSPGPQHRQMQQQQLPLQQRPSPAYMQRLLDDQHLKSKRQRSWSDLRSPSPQQQMPFYSPPAPTRTASGSSVVAGSQPAFSTVTGGGGGARKPTGLGLMQPRKFSSQESSPSSPNVTITPAEDVARQLMSCDSGNNSMTCSDHSSHSNFSEPQHPDMITFTDTHHQQRRALGSTSDAYIAEYDPIMMMMTQSTSHDSLFDSQTTSPMPTPSHQISVQRQQSGAQVSPRQSLTIDSGIMQSPKNIARQRPPGIPLEFPNPPHPISAPSSRPHSPKITSKASRASPTGSIKSEWSFPFYADDPDPMAMWVLNSDSDANSTASSMNDLRIEDDPPFLLQNSVNIDAVLYNTYK